MRTWLCRSAWVCLGMLLVVARLGADDTSNKPAAAGKKAVTLLDRMKSLEGDWEPVKPDDHFKAGQSVLQYRLIGGGSAVVETIMPGSPMEMLSVYHRDGDQLVMTHYCCVGNQPKMKARQGKDQNEIVFEFVGGTNVDPAKDAHIHGGTLRFLGPDHIQSEWEFYVKGKLSEKHAFELVRKKAKK